jgi:hypothetical protein
MSPGFAAFGNDLLKDRRAARDNIFQLRIGRNTVTRYLFTVKRVYLLQWYAVSALLAGMISVRFFASVDVG